MSPTEQDLRDLLRERSAAAPTPHDRIEAIERRFHRNRRRDVAIAVGSVAVAVAGIAVAASLLQGGGLVDRSLPVAPQPTESSPSPMPTAGWTGPLRPGTSLPIVPFEATWERDEYFWTDGPDASFAGIDIIEAQDFGPVNQKPRWSLLLREAPPLASTLDPTQRVIEYGVVVDADGDRAADCQIGINTDAPKAGDYRVWVRNLRTDVTDERVGPPYGFPIDFTHPDERQSDSTPERARTMSFYFLKDTVPCDPFTPSANFYAWASVTEDGRVTAWDYAPDAAWLAIS